MATGWSPLLAHCTQSLFFINTNQHLVIIILRVAITQCLLSQISNTQSPLSPTFSPLCHSWWRTTHRGRLSLSLSEGLASHHLKVSHESTGIVLQLDLGLHQLVLYLVEARADTRWGHRSHQWCMYRPAPSHCSHGNT